MVSVGNHRYMLELHIWDGINILSHLLNVVSRVQGGGVASNEDAPGQQIEVVVLWRISGTLEHVQHLLCYQETTWERQRE